MPRLVPERHEYIRRLLDRRGVVRTAELVATLGVSERTLQRDLDLLAVRGLLRRVHGGAVAAQAAAPAVRLRIGMVVPTRSSYYRDVVAGATEAAERINVQLVVGDYDYRTELEHDRLERVGRLDLDGVLLTVERGAAAYPQLESLAVPVVMVERPLVSAAVAPAPANLVAHVRSDHAAGGVLAVEHLVGLGHRRVRCLVRRTPTGLAVVGGIRGWAPSAEVPGLAVTVDEVPRAGDLGTGHPAVASLVAAAGRGEVTGIVVHNDQDAMVVLAGLAEAGVPVPHRVSVVSYDDVAAESAVPALTAVAPQRRWIGRFACEVLADHLRAAHRGVPERPLFELRLPPELVVRASTARAGGRRPRTAVRRGALSAVATRVSP